MNEIIFLGLCGFMVAGVICRPDRFLFAYVRRRGQEWFPERYQEWFPEPYLGEFIPVETPAQRQERESMAKLRRLLKKAEGLE